ncbi:MAG: tetratricopeptide repeat protein [Deltaproteobacteria bacterium]|nr:tetratricopeptide repeat protein [Deltaproteobacteria bacterium]
MTDRGKDCEAFWDLEDLARAGVPLRISDEEFRVEHRRACPLCGFERQVSALVGDVESAGPASLMTSAEEARFISAIEREVRADRTPSRGWVFEFARLFSVAPRRPAFAAAFLAVAAALAVSLYVARDTGGGRLFVVSGTATAGGAVLKSGDTLKEGAALVIAKGYTGFVPCYEVEVFADESSRMRLDRLSKKSCEISLEYGRVVARANAIPAGSRLMVSTHTGSAEVKGTVFAVETDGVETKVRVIEGAVLVRNTKGVERRVTSAMQADVRSGETGPAAPGDLERDTGLLGWHEPGVGRALEGLARVELVSFPDGAEVLLAQRPMGRTPLSALVPRGRYDIEVRAAGYEPVGEVLPVEGAAPVIRNYFLKRKTTDAASLWRIERPDSQSRPGGTSAAAQVETARGRRSVRGPGAGEGQMSVPDLLDTARILKEHRDFKGAADAYDEIVAKFPQSPEAKVAIVHLGFVCLDRLGRYERALHLFERYLGEAGDGILREEASWGRIKALGALGRPATEAAALREFISKYRSSPYLGEARARLLELESTHGTK